MTYKQALALKKAGFPQEKYGGCDIEAFLAEDEKELEKLGERVYFPILEEIIEELGNRFNKLEHLPHKNKWEAISFPRKIFMEKEVVIYIGIGKTPLEALINLYIKLNNK